MVSIQAFGVWSHSFPCFKCFSHAGAPLNHPLLLFSCSGVLKKSQKARFVIQDPFNLFRGCYLFLAVKFNPCILSFKSFYGVSFEWALTHRSFPRILLDSSYFPGAIHIFFFTKFVVRMIHHQSNAFLQGLSNSFTVGSIVLIFHSECLNNSRWCFSLSFEDRRRVSL